MPNPRQTLARFRRRTALILLMTLAAAGCNADLTQGPLNTPEEAQEFLTGIVNIMEARSVRRDSIDWTRFRDTVMWRGARAKAIWETLPAVALALELLGDNHSRFVRPDGSFLDYPRTIRCSGRFTGPLLDPPPDIGYVRVGAFSGDRVAEYTSTIQEVYRWRDSELLEGWIIDLRGNTGGNMWPMLASLWPFLQGKVGYFVDPDSVWAPWNMNGAGAYLGNVLIASATSPFQPRATENRVAVLIDGLVASSGEATAIALRGRPNTRFFGEPTCGVSTSNRGYSVGHGYQLGLTVGIMVGRDSTFYGGKLFPDVYAEFEAVEAEAIAWIRTGGQ